MNDKLLELLKYYSEGHTLDYKKTQYNLSNPKEKHEFLKDVSAMLNNPSNDDKYIIIGVKAKDNMADTFHDVGELFDQASYQQVCNSNIEPEINFEYNTFSYDGTSLAYFRIYNNDNRPYLFKDVKSHGETNKPGSGYIRVGTSTRLLLREDLERFYRDRSINKDRKSDLLVTPVLLFPNIGIPHNLICLDLRIENISNKSLKCDIEMDVYKGIEYALISEDDAKQMEYQKSGSNYAGIWTPVIPSFSYNFEISMEDKGEFYRLSKSRRIDSTNKVVIHQGGILENVFDKYLYIKAKENATVKVQIVIRSDEFTQGPYKSEHLIQTDSMN